MRAWRVGGCRDELGVAVADVLRALLLVAFLLGTMFGNG